MTYRDATPDNPPAETPAEQSDRVRQGERTIDNLKRLFAVVFAISFGVVGQSTFERVRPFLSGKSPPDASSTELFVAFEMVALFVITAGVFYHQSAKFLDVRYARAPLVEAHPVGFAFDYLSLIFTVAPFFLMAHTLDRDITSSVGYIWYFSSYIVLLGLGLILLIISDLRHMPFVRGDVLGEQIHQDEIVRDSTLRTYWLCMNGLIFLILNWLFYRGSVYGDCPTTVRPSTSPSFLYEFGVLAILRDYLDYRYAWRFLFPVRIATARRFDKWPLTAIVRSPRNWKTSGYLIVAAGFLVAWNHHLWNFAAWTTRCHL